MHSNFDNFMKIPRVLWVSLFSLDFVYLCLLVFDPDSIGYSCLAHWAGLAGIPFFVLTGIFGFLLKRSWYVFWAYCFLSFGFPLAVLLCN